MSPPFDSAATGGSEKRTQRPHHVPGRPPFIYFACAVFRWNLGFWFRAPERRFLSLSAAPDRPKISSPWARVGAGSRPWVEPSCWRRVSPIQLASAAHVRRRHMGRQPLARFRPLRHRWLLHCCSLVGAGMARSGGILNAPPDVTSVPAANLDLKVQPFISVSTVAFESPQARAFHLALHLPSRFCAAGRAAAEASSAALAKENCKVCHEILLSIFAPHVRLNASRRRE